MEKDKEILKIIKKFKREKKMTVERVEGDKLLLAFGIVVKLLLDHVI